MAIANPSAKDSKKTLVHMENLSFDPTHEVLARIPLTINAVSGASERTTGIQGNSSLVLTYTGDNLTTLEKTVGATTYSKTFTWTGDNLTGVSTWS